MVCHNCGEEASKHGKDRKGKQRFRCRDCARTWTKVEPKLIGDMRLNLATAEMILKCLCEGMSARATARLTRTDVHSVIDLMVTVGTRCKRFLEHEIAGVYVDDIQADEVWQFIFCKQKTADRKGLGPDCGDSYCFTVVERSTKMVVAWHLGHRTPEDTYEFCRKLHRAAAGTFQISTDGYGPYRTAIPDELSHVHYGMLVKIFGDTPKDEQRTYSPAKITSTRKEAILGIPDMDRVCTSHTERHNGSMRNFIKRMGRLTYCFSKRWENHEAMLGLYFAFFNYCRKHGTLKTTPAVAAGLANCPWTIRGGVRRVFGDPLDLDIARFPCGR